MPDLSRVGPYELLRPLGAGGMAQTFVAVRRGPAGFEQRVCLKRILPNHAADRLFVEQFLDEARLLANLRHGGIVQVYDFGEIEGSYFMALELVDGLDLDRLLVSLSTRSERLPLTVSLHVAGQILSALHYAHGAELDGEPLHIVHRDISPGNILLSRQGEVKLADFGIAKSRHRMHKTQAGFTKGKIAYMSPEQVRGEDLDRRSDLFAVGVVLHEMVTGVHPFDAPTDITTLSNILSGTRPPLRSLVPDLGSDVAALLNALLATDAKMRPASAAEALRLIPALEQAFVIERKLAEVVQVHAGSTTPSAPRAKAKPGANAGAAAKAGAQASAGPSVPDVPWDAATMPLPAPGGGRAPERLGEPSTALTSFRPGATEEHDLLGKPRRSTASLWLLSLTIVVLAAGSWLGYRYVRAGAPFPAAATGAAPSAARAGELDPVTAPLTPTRAEAPKAATPEEPLEQAHAGEQLEDPAARMENSPRAPVILHAPDSDPARALHGLAQPRGDARRPKRPIRATPQPEAPPAREPPPPEPAPAIELRPKHRTGSSLSTDQF